MKNKLNIKTLKIDNGDRVLLHIHGFAGCKEENYPLMDYCKENNITFIGIDFPGQGEVPINYGKDKSTMNHFADLAVKYIKSLNIDKLIVSGHSMGGAIATIIASKLTEEHVTQLILEDPVNLSLLDNESERKRLFEMCEGGTSHLVYKNNELVNEQLDNVQRIWFRELALNFTSPSLLKKLKKITYELEIPMDVIFGEDDKVISYSESVAAFKNVEKNHKIKIHSIPNAAHKPHFENTDAYLKAIKSILG